LQNEREQNKYFSELTADYPTVSIQTTIFDLEQEEEDDQQLYQHVEEGMCIYI
jgi:hypothetical protein